MNVRSENTSEPRRGRGRPLVDDKRRRILDAALTVFAERGYHGTTVPEVAAAAGVGTGTLYRYFEHKEALVNQLYRDAKQRLRAALLDDLPALLRAPADPARSDADAQAWFTELWRRLGGFARTEPEAFRFLEMQDHAPYLDAESKQLELSVLAPLYLAGKKLRAGTAGTQVTAGTAGVDTLIALLWGAFVGLVKASRLGYLTLDDRRLAEAGDACWRMIAPDALPTERTAHGHRSDRQDSARRPDRTGRTRPAGRRASRRASRRS